MLYLIECAVNFARPHRTLQPSIDLVFFDGIGITRIHIRYRRSVATIWTWSALHRDLCLWKCARPPVLLPPLSRISWNSAKVSLAHEHYLYTIPDEANWSQGGVRAVLYQHWSHFCFVDYLTA